MDDSQIYFKGLVEYLSWYGNIPKTTSLDISSEVNLEDLNSLFSEVDLKFYIPDSLINKIKGNTSSYPLKPTCFLLGIGFTPKMVEHIIKHYGTSDRICSIVRENPYDMINVEGTSFKKIDKIALEVFHFDDNSPLRLKAMILNQLKVMSNKGGHLYLEISKFVNSNFEVNFNIDILKKYIKELIIDKKIYLVGSKIYSSHNYKAEVNSSKIIAKLITDKEFTSSSFEGVDPDKFIKGYEEIQTQNIVNGKWKKLKWGEDKFKLSDKQKKAIKKFIEEKFLIITGMPGTGKSTLTKALVDISRSRNLKVSLMAPTGIAAKRLTEATSYEATTIHKKLGYNGLSYGRDENNKFIDDVYIIDEFSMVDQALLYSLIRCLPDKEFKLVFIGDYAQLPSVAPGNVLKELLKSGMLPHVDLDKIFRQEDTSDIIINSHKINNGHCDFVNNRKDFIFINYSDEDKILESIVKIVDKVKDKNFQVLSPTYKGILGVVNINNTLQELLNPDYDSNFFKTDKYNFRVNDKIMILKNDYTSEVYNGEQGEIVGIDKKRRIIQIFINGKTIEYTFNDAYNSITLDYSRTVHKSQSQEYDIVILPWVDYFGGQLQRNLLYTAVTRAKEKVFILGNTSALRRAINNNNTTKRNSVLSSRILSEISKIEEENKIDTYREEL